MRAVLFGIAKPGHGVGKPGAKDQENCKTKPVTNLKKNEALYDANKKSDREKDSVACEMR